MRIKTNRGVEDLNLKKCCECGHLEPPLKIFYSEKLKKSVCVDCFNNIENPRPKKSCY